MESQGQFFWKWLCVCTYTHFDMLLMRFLDYVNIISLALWPPYTPHIFFFFFLMLKLWPRHSEVFLVLKACVFLSAWWWPSVTGLKRYSQDGALVIELWSLIGCSLNPFMLLACSVLLWAISCFLSFFIRKAKILIIVHSMGMPPGLVFSYSLNP